MSKKRAGVPHPIDGRLVKVAGVLVLVSVIVGLLFYLAPDDTLVGQAAGLRCALPPRGLVHWYPGEGDADDMVGIDDGSPAGDVTLGRGKVGQAFTLDGDGDYVDLGLQDFEGEEGSLVVWAKSGEALAAVSRWILSRNVINHVDGDVGIYYVGGDNIYFFIQNGGLNQYINSNFKPAQNTWHLYVLTWDETGLHWYIDNDKQGENNRVNPVLPHATASFHIGGQGDPNALGVNNWNGQIDEVMFFNKALTPEEVVGIYTADRNGVCKFGIDVDCTGELDGQTFGRMLCLDNSFMECGVDADAGEEQGGFQCIVPEDAEPYWEILCNEDTRFAITQDESQLCDGNRFISCADFRRSPVYDPRVAIICGADNKFSVAEKACNDDRDNDHDGLLDGADDSCQGEVRRIILPSNHFEATLKTTDLFSTTIANNLPITACDVGTRNTADELTYCVNDNPAPVRVPSLRVLRETNQAPPLLNNRYLLLYDEPVAGEAKTLSILQRIFFDNVPYPLPRTKFTGNLLAGQRLALGYNNQYYLLSHPADEPLFRMEELRLTHIPTGQVFTPLRYPGTTQYYFDVFGGDATRIVVTFRRDNFVISTIAPGELPQAFVLDHNLEQDYEVKVTREQPVRITAPAGVGQLAICNDDEHRFTRQVLLCQNDVPLISPLTRDELVVVDTVAMRYMIANAQKEVSVYSLTPLTGTGEEESLDFSHTVDALAEGRNIALQFEGKLYLLSHTGPADDVKLTTTRLQEFTDAGTANGAPIPAQGTEDKVHFMVSGGRITLVARTAPQPFVIYGESTQRIADQEIRLNEQLFHSMTNKVPARVVAPQNFGLISVHPNDIAGDERTLKLQFSNTVDGFNSIDVNLRTPSEVENVLFYYDNSRIDAVGTYVKNLKLYYLLDTVAPVTYPYNDLTIPTLTAGGDSRIALKFNGEYYLFGHEASAREARFFNLADFRITNLDGSNPLTPVIVGETARFIIGNGKIEVTADVDTQELRFTATPNDRLAEEAFEGYQDTITTSNKLVFGAEKVWICNQHIFGDLPTAQLCHESAAVSHLDVFSTKTTVLDGKHYWLEINGQTRDNKQVLVRNIREVTTDKVGQQFDWADFVTNVSSNNKPLFNISGKYYLPSTPSSLLRDFRLTSTSGEEFVLRGLQGAEGNIPPFNGSFVLREKIITAKQLFSAPNAQGEVTVNLQLYRQPFYFIPEDNTPLRYNMTEDPLIIKFITGIGGQMFVLEYVDGNMNITQLKLTDSQGTVYFNRFFAVGDSKTLFLDNVKIRLTIHSIDEDFPTLELQRIP